MRVKDYPKIGVRVCTEKLENGLSVFVVPTPGYNKTFAFFATDYGGADRRFRLGGQWRDTPAGIAHFLEHKMFDIENEENALTQLSAKGASPNAFTSSDITAYHFESTESFWENLEILLKFVSVPYFTDESVAKEQGIIGQEIRMTEDDPEFSMYYGFLSLLYKDNPIRESVAGTVESISEITAKTLYDCHKVFYTPSNMVLTVAGDVDAQRVIETAECILPKVYGANPERDYGNEKGLKPYKNSGLRAMEVGLPMFLAGARAPAVTGKELQKQEFTAILALGTLMGRSSSLYADLYAKGLINSGFSAQYDHSAGVAHCIFGGESSDPNAVLEAVKAEIGRVISNGCDEKLVERLKRARTGDILRGLNSFETICYNVAKGYFRGFDPFEALPTIEGISADHVNSFITESLRPENIAINVITKK